MQVFNKITPSNPDNPQNLLLKKGMQGKEVFQPNAGKEVYDTIIPFLAKGKAKISLATQTQFEKAYQKSLFEAKLTQLCDNQLYYHNCYDKVEKAILKTDRWVKREGDILIFPLKSEGQYFLRDNSQFGESTQKFHYQGFVNTITGKIFITYGSYWEWQNYRVLHQNSGEEILVTYAPQISPNGKYLIAANNVSLYPMSGTSIQLWEISENGFTLVWEFISSYYVPEKMAWLTDNEVLFSAVKSFGNNEPENRKITYGKINFE